MSMLHWACILDMNIDIDQRNNCKNWNIICLISQFMCWDFPRHNAMHKDKWSYLEGLGALVKEQKMREWRVKVPDALDASQQHQALNFQPNDLSLVQENGPSEWLLLGWIKGSRSNSGNIVFENCGGGRGGILVYELVCLVRGSPRDGWCLTEGTSIGCLIEKLNL